MYESPVETVEKALGSTSSGQGPHIPSQFERHAEFNASIGDDAWLLKIDKNPSITVPTRKGGLITRLTSRSIRIVLPRLVYIAEVSVVPREVSWLLWINSSFEWTSPLYFKNITKVPAANRENPRDFPLAARWDPFPLHCMQSNSVFPIKHVRNLGLLVWTPDSPQEHCSKMKRTLMSTQECKIAWCTPNQIEMRPISLALAP